ncbi:PHP domain-containing protein [Cohnella abietis]|uniref:PHP-like protein n=1 Tax=Cohnella abietis TaxID=2507935 RepID=A0A3T1D8X0_9BACL|nr:PHP domain-containing protein [Cohnella abietis]BBI34542.1 PHP-like protein [Cohnella abietis]
MNNKADLHSHTTASDGMFSPTENVRMAKELGLDALAITDHDTLSGIEEALEAGKAYGIVVVPGVEISTADNGKDIHILGYGISHEDSQLQDRLLSLRDVRNRRNADILARLNQLGMSISQEELEVAAGKTQNSDGSVGRPHIAQVLVDKGYVDNIRDAFEKYIGEGKPAFVNPPRITPSEAVAWIHEAGGTAIIAHPGLYNDDDLVLSILDAGADGLEAYHSDHDPQMEQRYRQWAEDRSKLVTGGSDFHGIKDGVAFHGTMGSRWIDSSIVNRFI